MKSIVIMLAPRCGHEENPDQHPCYWLTGDRCQQGTLEQAIADAASQSLSVYLVMSVADGLMTQAILSKRQARHIRRILPYVLEDALLNSPEKLWFAHGKGRGETWPVVLCERDYLQQLCGVVRSSGVVLRGVWLDADLLEDRAPLVAETPLSDEVLVLPGGRRALTVPATEVTPVMEMVELSDGDYDRIQDPRELLLLLNDALVSARGINLLHSEMRPVGPGDGSRPVEHSVLAPWYPVARVAAVVLLLVWSMMFVQRWSYEQAAEDMRLQANAIYEELYPDDLARALVGQFGQRIRQMGGGDQAGPGFVQLMAPAGEAFAELSDSQVELRRINFDQREQLLQVDVRATDFDHLEQIRSRLQARGLDADIAEGRSQGDRVTARIRIGKS